MAYITDICLNKIGTDNETNNKLPFIVIHLSNGNSNLLWQLQGFGPTNVVLKLNYKDIFTFLGQNNVDGTKFAPLGDIWMANINNKVIVLLVNVHISVKPIDFVKVDNYYGAYSLWRPVCPDGFSALGNLVSNNKPSINLIRCLSNMFLKNYVNNEATVGRFTNMNEYDLLASVDEQFYTINKNFFMKDLCKDTKQENKENFGGDKIFGEGYNVTLLESDDPWFQKMESDYDKRVIGKANPETFEGDSNYSFVISSLLLIIMLILAFRYSWWKMIL